MKTPLACDTCHNDEPHYEVALCSVCLERAICCDCRTPLQAELDVCSDDCAIAVVSKLKEQLLFANRAIGAMRRCADHIRHMEPDIRGYAYAFGAVQCEAMNALASSAYVWDRITEETAGPVVATCDETPATLAQESEAA